MAIFEPANQTTYNTPVDQRTIQQTSPYNSIKPSVYLTRTIHRLAATTHGSPNIILSGMDVTYANGAGLNPMTFSVAPGSIMVDSVIIDTLTTTTILTGVIPITSPSKLKVGIFAAYNFSATSNTSLAFTSYIFDMQDNLIEPTIFGGNEKVLLAMFEVDLSGANLTQYNRINDWIVNINTTVSNNVYYAGNGLRVHNQFMIGSEVSRTISGLVVGVPYRVRMNGTPLAQILVGSFIGDGTLLTAVGSVDGLFTPTSTTAIITLHVNSVSVSAEATFLAIDIRRDNTNNAQVVTSTNGIGAISIKQLTTNNPSNRLSNSLHVGLTEYIVTGGSSRKDAIESAALSIFDHSVGEWVSDVPRFKPTRYNLPYSVTSILF